MAKGATAGVKLYAVANWADHFENNRTRELKRMDWVPFPNKHDGDGYTELLDHQNGAAHYGAWCAIVQVASKCEPRGTLIRSIPHDAAGSPHHGAARSQDAAATILKPHDSASLARITRISRVVFDEAIPRLVGIGWLVIVSSQVDLQQQPTEIPQEGAAKSQEGAGLPQDDAVSRVRAHAGAEWNGIEGNGTERDGMEVKGSEFANANSCPAESGTAGAAASIRAVYGHYRTHHPRAAERLSSDSPAWKKIRARLREGYTVEQLCRAIDGNHISPFHCGENDDGRKHHDLELIVRDTDKVRKFIEIADSGPGRVLSEKTQRTERAAQNVSNMLDQFFGEDNDGD